MLSYSAEEMLAQAETRAVAERCRTVMPEHLLLTLVEAAPIRNYLAGIGADLTALELSLHSRLKEAPRFPAHAPIHGAASFDSSLHDLLMLVETWSPPFGDGEPDCWTLFEGFVDNPRILCSGLLAQCGVSTASFEDYIEKIMVEQKEYDFMNVEKPKAAKKKPGKDSILVTCCTNLNDLAKDGGIDPVIGRGDEIEETITILRRLKKCNPLLVGEPGVGKTAIAEGLALAIYQGKVPDFLKDSTVYSLNMGALVAGTKYRGEFEAKMESLLADLKNDGDAILYIDEFHTVMGAGGTSGNALDASNILKPALAKGNIKVLGATTLRELRVHIETDKALLRRFELVMVNEPDEKNARAIIRQMAPLYMEHHHVYFSRAALKEVVPLAKKHLPKMQLPDSALTILDQAAARLSSKGKVGATVTVGDMQKTVARMARIPAAQVKGAEIDRLKRLGSDMRRAVFQQDKAIGMLTSAIERSRAGISNPDRPVGSYLFSGPTGVGKTEVARQLAETLGVKLLRFDMSEYMEGHSISRLIGAPPGYVGFDQGGLLTDAVDQTPHCVLLLDEIEKAHPDLYNILLQVMDRGKLTDHNGKEVDFRNVIVIMTTNAGAAQLSKSPMGFNQAASTADTDAINRMFAPEFRNRLDAIVPFEFLTPETIRKVAEKFLGQLGQRLKGKHVTLEADARAVDYLVAHGYKPEFGARPMARLIQDQLETPLAPALLFGELARGGTAKISATEDGSALTHTFNAKARKPRTYASKPVVATAPVEIPTDIQEELAKVWMGALAEVEPEPAPF